ncbi:MAG: NADH-quinone oxidoreductase subunit M [Bdellovibrionaceae bacterium]|nr:NADH-quinone oxidoreductase subunit M [Pseudobdellovibrionaceae bacterium]
MILTLLVALPILLALMLLPVKGDRAVRVLSLVGSIGLFILSLCALTQFDKASSDFQLTEYVPWIPNLGISYFVGVDGFSILLVVLTSLLTPIVIGASWTAIEDRVKGFHIALLILQAAVIGSFISIDTVLFYLFFELSLVPMYFIVGIWGGENRIYATYKFFIYTMAGSVLMLAGIAYMMIQAKSQIGYYTADVMELYKITIPYADGFFTAQTLLFFAFSIAFAIKVPVFPVHTWLPDAHVQAPTAGSVILAGVMLKMGTYGFLRFVLPMFPEAVQHYGWVFLILGVIGIIYGALVAMVQVDVKKLVAYSSVSHMGYVMLGLFVVSLYGINGGVFQMLAHGVSTGGLFLMVGMIYERTHSREIAKYGGLAKAMPVYTILFLIITFSSIAVPMTNGFVGEFLILLGTFGFNPWLGGVAVIGVVLGAAYMLWMVKKVFFGEAGELVDGSHGTLKDLNIREIAVLVPIVVLIFWMGILPNHFLGWSEASIKHLVENKNNYELKLYSQPSGVAER